MANYRGFYKPSLTACGTRFVYDPILKGSREAFPTEYFIDKGAAGNNLTVSTTNDPGLKFGSVIYLEGGGDGWMDYNNVRCSGLQGNAEDELKNYIIFKNYKGRIRIKPDGVSTLASGFKINAGCKYFILDGRGDGRFLGHSASGVPQSGNYGILLDTGWPTGSGSGKAQNMSIEVSDVNSGVDADTSKRLTNVIIETVEIANAAFAAVAKKSDNYTDLTDNANMYGCVMSNVLCHNSFSESLYFGKVDKRPARHAGEADHAMVDLRVHNCLSLYARSEGIQTQRLTRFTHQSNNINFASGCGWTNPFQNNQDYNTQLYFNMGGTVSRPALFEKNMNIGACSGLLFLKENALKYRDGQNAYLQKPLRDTGEVPTPTGEVVFKNNFWGGTRSKLLYLVPQAGYSINYHFEDNYFRGWRQDRYLVHGGSTPDKPLWVDVSNNFNKNRIFTRRNKVLNDDPLGRPFADDLNRYTRGAGADADNLNYPVKWPVFMNGLTGADWWKFVAWANGGTYYIGSNYDTTKYNYGYPNNFSEGMVALEMSDKKEFIGAFMRKIGAGTGNEQPSTNPLLYDAYALPLDFRLDPNHPDNEDYLLSGMGLVVGEDTNNPTDNLYRYFLKTKAKLANII